MENGTMLQGFQWELPADGRLWRQLAFRAIALRRLGFTAVWLPPAFKGAGGASDVGYGVYDLYDLGEFHQKGSTRTKYGSKLEYLLAIRAGGIDFKTGVGVGKGAFLRQKMHGFAAERHFREHRRAVICGGFRAGSGRVG